jgi:hypothetical protein
MRLKLPTNKTGSEIKKIEILLIAKSSFPKLNRLSMAKRLLDLKLQSITRF